MSSSHTVLKYLRLIHLYTGIFIAPALLFFAFTGALQIFSLHETTRGSSYKPPAWAVMLGQIHKKQTPIVPVRKPAPLDKTGRQDHSRKGTVVRHISAGTGRSTQTNRRSCTQISQPPASEVFFPPRLYRSLQRQG